MTDLFAQLDFLEDVVVEDDLTGMSVFELNKVVHDIDRQLVELDELLSPVTQEGRDLHSRRGAARVILMNKMNHTEIPHD